MARTDAIVDAGPLVAYFNRRDQHHAWARKQMAHLEVPLFTCEAVLSESFHLLEGVRPGTERLLDFLDRGAVTAQFSYTEHAGRVHELMRAYADQPMSLADACLVCLAEVHPASRIVTTNDDFRVYRRAEDEPLDVFLPGE